MKTFWRGFGTTVPHPVCHEWCALSCQHIKLRPVASIPHIDRQCLRSDLYSASY